MSKEKLTLAIMAAGMGSRFGEGIKQLTPVNASGEILMDYSIHDAIAAGFNKIIFIIRKSIEEDFKKIIGNRIKSICASLGVETYYIFQEIENIPEEISLMDERTKPWGTGHAVLACKDIINEPFVVINADDYYGKEAFIKMYDFLTTNAANDICMAGFILKNTLSENGGVTRGICEVDKDGYLIKIQETYEIIKTSNGAESKGEVLDKNAIVSMNMWGMNGKFMEILEDEFKKFFGKIKGKEETAEFNLPIIIAKLLKKNKIRVKVLETNDKWFGTTYKEDKEMVSESIKKLTKAGYYKESLYSDLK